MHHRFKPHRSCHHDHYVYFPTLTTEKTLTSVLPRSLPINNLPSLSMSLHRLPATAFCTTTPLPRPRLNRSPSSITHLPIIPCLPLHSRASLHRSSSISSTTHPTSTSDMLVDSFLLRTSPRWITVEPANPAVPHQNVLYINRNTLEASLRKRDQVAALAEPDTEQLIFGLAGFIDTLHDAYLIVISKRQLVGSIMEHRVWRVTTLSAIPIRGPKMLKKLAPSLGLSKQNLADESLLRGMLNAAVSLPGFYYSHDMDITRSAQKRADAAAKSQHGPASSDFTRADMRFVWNRFAGNKLADLGAVSWIVPLILGYVDVRNGLVNGKAVELALISRRAADRPGLRFTARGADVYGNCSNFVETEQIVSHGKAYSSYVQIRGSIPLLWKQEANIKYKPKPVLKEVDAGGKSGLCQQAFERHFDSLFDHYGSVTAISLVDDRGSEQMLNGALVEAVKLMASQRLHFVPWDFHKQTKGMKYEKVDHELLPMIDSDLIATSYFYTPDGISPSMHQRGIVRTNCIDSLDRTNVVQSVIAHRIMDGALKVMGVLNSIPETCSVAKFDAFEKDFKNTWADHADALSKVYAGSGALKTDYTRTGKRTVPGMVQDGIRAVQRYVFQNALDGQRQDGIDLFLGVVTMPEKSAVAPRDMSSIQTKAEPLLVREKYLPHMVFFCSLVAVLSWFLLKSTSMKVVVLVIGIAGMGFFSQLMLQAGHKLVARPRLDGTN